MKQLMIPIAMVVPNSQGVHAVSRLAKPEYKDISQMSPKDIKVSFQPDGTSNPITKTAYSNGLDCWWILPR